MPIQDETPTFNLKAVVQETGLKPDTLRAWERRYGLPQPERSTGGHRLYSQHDIDILKWLVVRQEEGLSISRAVDLWRQLEAEGQDPLTALSPALPHSINGFQRGTSGDTLERLTQDWITACLAFDEPRAEQILSHAFALHSVETVCLELLMKGMAQIGEGWAEGEVMVQQEHFASELAMRRLETLLAASPASTRPGRTLLACPPEEEHVFGPLLITLFLRRRGWSVLYLGADVPSMWLKRTIASVKPNLVILVAQQLPTAATLLEMSQVLREEETPLAFGGMIFNSLPVLRSYIPGHFVGEQLDQAVVQIEQWLTALGSLPPAEATQVADKAHQQALVHYREKLGLIESEVWQSLKRRELSPRHLVNAHKGIARNLTAGLIFGNLDFVSIDLIRVAILHLPAELMADYLQFYYEAAKTHLAEPGRSIINWLAQLVEES